MVLLLRYYIELGTLVCFKLHLLVIERNSYCYCASSRMLQEICPHLMLLCHLDACREENAILCGMFYLAKWLLHSILHQGWIGRVCCLVFTIW